MKGAEERDGGRERGREAHTLIYWREEGGIFFFRDYRAKDSHRLITQKDMHVFRDPVCKI